MTAPVTLPRLLRFWLPLQATWLMMAVEGPFLAAVIARLAEAKPNLAAYGVAYAFAIIVEAPVIMMMSAATAVVDARPGYLALRRFAVALNAGITAIMLALLATGAMGWILHDLLQLTPEVAGLTRRALWILLPWPAAIGYRRFYQGILIRAGHTRRVAWGTVSRLVAMAAGALLARAAGLPGALVGATALAAGVCVEAAASRLMAIGPVRRLAPASAAGEGAPAADVADLSWRGLSAFYWPLALTSTISLAVHPLLTFFMGRAAAPLESLAVLPVLNGLVFLFRTPALSYQDAAIAMLGAGPQNRRPVMAFAGLLAAAASAGLLAVAWTPVSSFWFLTVSGLEPELAAYATVPVRILAPMPALSVLLNLQRALLVHRRRTGPVTTASAVEVSVLATVLGVGVLGLGTIGVVAAAVAFMAGRLAANLTLLAPSGRALAALRAGSGRS
jgi:progressive ankylosis protein